MNAESSDYPELLTAAVLAYTGYGDARTPRDDAAAVRALAHGDDGESLLAIVEHLASNSEAVEADWDEAVDGSLFPVFAAKFSVLHPGLSTEALRALSWRWAYYRFR